MLRETKTMVYFFALDQSKEKVPTLMRLPLYGNTRDASCD